MGSLCSNSTISLYVPHSSHVPLAQSDYSDYDLQLSEVQALFYVE